ncbi:SGNH/GDSL hydrolase family protein [Streptomyces lushanensis]|uniref:SGNH/GDSL hydrolase family protein n=1 Tax=Streptomyces lushanensis TaxID=1434255 RepID=UPI00082C0205|nr:SGNH/GDSL hydrolase family protein [Streptomyces lushanensis]
MAVSLGDSFISGEGGRWQGNIAMQYTSDTDMWGTDRACNAAGSCGPKDPTRVYGTSYVDPVTSKENGCHRSDVAEIQSADLPVDKRVNLACSGAVTKDVLPRSAGGQTYKGEKPQTDQLADLADQSQIKLVQLSIGGNDLGFGGVIKGCVKTYVLKVTSYCWKSWDATVKERLRDHVLPRVKDTVKAIRGVLAEHGHPVGSYVFALQSYPAPVPQAASYRYPQGVAGIFSDRYQKGGCPFYDQDTDWARRTVVPAIAETLEKAADDTGIAYLDLQWAFDGHEVCNTATQLPTSANTLANPVPGKNAEWMRFLSQGPVQTPYSQGQQEESFHPNSYGQKALGKCLTEFHKAVTTSSRKFECLNTPGQDEQSMHVQPIS